FDMMVKLGQASGATTLKTLWNQQCTTEGIKAAIAEVGAACGPEDCFVFYYTGHGDQLPQDGDDSEAFDQCFCLVDANGNTDDATMTYRNQVWMRDDDFAEAILDSVDSDVKVLVLIDACHSGTMCDFTAEHSEWGKKSQRAISISGCEDTQTSAGTGKGGYFTHALMRATQALQEEHEDGSYTVASMYNMVMEKYNIHKSSGHTQRFDIHGCAIRPQEFVWPLQPLDTFISPVGA
ncbi:unnamed protein product, partial [Polarella glacialis]